MFIDWFFQFNTFYFDLNINLDFCSNETLCFYNSGLAVCEAIAVKHA